MRDWSRTIWPASFKGAPFHTESRRESGGRRVVSHQFPGRDDPFHEDLGEDLRKFSIDAYVASDLADAQAAALLAAFSSKGPGVLVLPTHGPRQVRCLSWERSESKDRGGYIAFTAEFVREGAATAVATLGSLANAVFVAVSVLTTAITSATRSRVALLGQPDHVVQSTRNAFEIGLTRFDLLRSSAAIDPDTSQTVARTVAKLFAQSDDLVSSTSGLDETLPDQVFDLALAAGEGMQPDSAARTFSSILNEPATVEAPATTISAATAQANVHEMDRLFRFAALAAYCEALARQVFPSRREGITARADAAEFFAAAIAQASGAENAGLLDALLQARSAVIDLLSRTVADLAPVVVIEAAASLPSVVWGWKLYRDPARGAEIVSRNKIPHAGFVPFTFEALAPGQ